ncbi:MAG: histidine phosphatase family protein [SAR324 cluster bacterium]|nr:histidine phosphatase family protein [SAR324 cluster bacterium]
MPTVIYITRHGLSEHNLNTQFYMGRSPASRLTEEGRGQARRLGQRLARIGAIDQIVCSSLPRTVETAQLIATELGVEALAHEDAFWELSKGGWEGVMPVADLPPEVRQALDTDPFGFRYPQGESYRDVYERVAPVFDRWVRGADGRTLLFVMHGDVIRTLLYHLLRIPPDKIGDFVIHPCSLTEFLLTGSRYHLVRYNDDSHLH